MAAPSSLETSPNAKSIKRKADEAFDALDDALRLKEGRPSSLKRANTSIYGSLAKYGIFTRPSSSKTTSTPTLTALLSRARSKKKPLPIPQYTTTSSATPEYSPGSTEAFLHRLCTFNLSTYSSKPPQIDAVAASKAGWINEGGKDRLYCAICKVGWVVAGREGLSRDAANSLVEKQRQSLIEMHKEGCPWRVRQCDSLVYRIPLQSPTSLVRKIKSHATELESVIHGIIVRHPLSSTQVQAFTQIVSSVPNHTITFPASTLPSSESPAQSPTPLPSTSSLLTSLFGWTLVPPSVPISRKSSSASLTLARSQSRASSVRDHTSSPDGTPTPPSFHIPAEGPTTLFGTPVTGKSKVDLSTAPPPLVPMSLHREPPQQKDALLHCQMCQRRIGLWAFAAPKPSSSPGDPNSTSHPNTINRPQRQLDLLREHRSYCPYVVKSTPLPSLPSHPPSTASSTPRSSFNLARTATSSSVGETQGSSSAFNVRRTPSLLSSVSSHARTGSLPDAQSMSLRSLDHTYVEGWRAVLNTVLRFGMAERSRARAHPQALNNSVFSHQPGSECELEHAEKNEDDAMSGVIELVEGVKQHGGKQLLSYVRSLLG